MLDDKKRLQPDFPQHTTVIKTEGGERNMFNSEKFPYRDSQSVQHVIDSNTDILSSSIFNFGSQLGLVSKYVYYKVCKGSIISKQYCIILQICVAAVFHFPRRKGTTDPPSSFTSARTLHSPHWGRLGSPSACLLTGRCSACSDPAPVQGQDRLPH